MLFAADVLGIVLAFLCARLLIDLGGGRDLYSGNTELLLFLLSLPAWVVMVKLYGLYDRDDALAHNSTVDDLPGVFHLFTVGSVVVFVAGRVFGVYEWPLRPVLEFALLAMVFVITGRAAVRAICRRLESLAQKTVIVGAGEVGQ